MGTNWTKAEGRESLATISSLKRSLGIPNHPSKKDEIVYCPPDKKGKIYGGQCHIYTTDRASAELMAELLWRWANAGRYAFYDRTPNGSLRDDIKVEALGGGGFDASIPIYHAPGFTKGLEKILKKHISPDRSFNR